MESFQAVLDLQTYSCRLLSAVVSSPLDLFLGRISKFSPPRSCSSNEADKNAFREALQQSLP